LEAEESTEEAQEELSDAEELSEEPAEDISLKRESSLKEESQ